MGNGEQPDHSGAVDEFQDLRLINCGRRRGRQFFDLGDQMPEQSGDSIQRQFCFDSLQPALSKDKKMKRDDNLRRHKSGYPLGRRPLSIV